MAHYRRHNKNARGSSKKQNYDSRLVFEDSNSSVYKKQRRFKLTYCSLCPPHGGENRRRQERPTKYKDRRKGKL